MSWQWTSADIPQPGESGSQYSCTQFLRNLILTASRYIDDTYIGIFIQNLSPKPSIICSTAIQHLLNVSSHLRLNIFGIEFLFFDHKPILPSHCWQCHPSHCLDEKLWSHFWHPSFSCVPHSAQQEIILVQPSKYAQHLSTSHHFCSYYQFQTTILLSPRIFHQLSNWSPCSDLIPPFPSVCLQ